MQRTLLRQGVTTVIVGQDGVSYAPGSGTYATDYFAAINGPHPTYRGGGVAAFLAAVDGASACNAAYLVPAGTLRHEVCGRDRAPATAEQRERMAALVATGMADGALGLSTGLDYVPGIFQSADEIAALCGPVARAGGVYVSHMRGGYEANAAAGIAEIIEIAEITAAAAEAPLPVHVSHFHADADIVLAQLARLERAGVDATFDAYPYTRGCTLLSMPLLPHELSAQPVDDVVHALTDPVVRPQLRAACLARATQSPSLGPDWPRLVTLAHLAAPEYAWAHGLTLHEAGRRAGVDPMDLALDALAACRLEASAIMAVRHARPATELARIFAHPRHTGGLRRDLHRRPPAPARVRHVRAVPARVRARARHLVVGRRRAPPVRPARRAVRAGPPRNRRRGRDRRSRPGRSGHRRRHRDVRGTASRRRRHRRRVRRRRAGARRRRAHRRSSGPWAAPRPG